MVFIPNPIKQSRATDKKVYVLKLLSHLNVFSI